MPTKHNIKAKGFTLVELSIVLVIIGLIVGGVLTGLDLIKSAEIRAQIRQIAEYNTALNTFKAKYNYLPGDLPPSEATAVGFSNSFSDGWNNNVRDGVTIGNGDGFITDVYGLHLGGYSNYDRGEAMLFWLDLEAANLIHPSLTTLPAPAFPSGGIYPNPIAKLGNNNFVLIDELNHQNTFLLQKGNPQGGIHNGTAALSPLEAQAIDGKIDDGLPLSGKVTVCNPTYCSAGANSPADGICRTAITNPQSYNTTVPAYANTPSCWLNFSWGAS
jgi:prepilin-type N-terminal cleavage/methylation domain-containing protein